MNHEKTISEDIYKHIPEWKTKASMYSWLRGQIRKIWKNHPARSEFVKASSIPISAARKSQFHRSTKFICRCSICREYFPKSKVQTDHIIPAGSCNSIESAQSFLLRIAFCPWENMRIVCVPCHQLITLAEHQGISIDDARIEKRVIAFRKLKAENQLLELSNLQPSLNLSKTNVHQRITYFRQILQAQGSPGQPTVQSKC